MEKSEIHKVKHTRLNKLKQKKIENLIEVPSFDIIPNLEFVMGLSVTIITLLGSTRPRHPSVYYSELLLSPVAWVPQSTYAIDQIEKILFYFILFYF
jgi:hypothetical protein